MDNIHRARTDLTDFVQRVNLVEADSCFHFGDELCQWINERIGDEEIKLVIQGVERAIDEECFDSRELCCGADQRRSAHGTTPCTDMFHAGLCQGVVKRGFYIQ